MKNKIMIMLILFIALWTVESQSNNNCMAQLTVNTIISSKQNTSWYKGGYENMNQLIKKCQDVKGAMDLNPKNEQPVCALSHRQEWLDLRPSMPGSAREVCHFSDYRQYPPFYYEKSCQENYYNPQWGKPADIPNNFIYTCNQAEGESADIQVRIEPFRHSAFAGNGYLFYPPIVAQAEYRIQTKTCKLEMDKVISHWRVKKAESTVFHIDHIKMTINDSNLEGELYWPCAKDSTGKETVKIICEMSR